MTLLNLQAFAFCLKRHATARGRRAAKTARWVPARPVIFLGALSIAALSCGPFDRAMAEVMRIEIDNVTVVPNKADQTGRVGDYEIIVGRAFGAIDPKSPLNAGITDIALAPRNAKGLVEYDTKFTLAKPVDMTKASGVLWYDIVNRARGSATPNADGHLMLVSGWQGDIVQTRDNHTARVPVAKNADGSPVTGPVLARITDVLAGTKTMPLALLGREIPYDAATLDTSKARLRVKWWEKRDGEIGPTTDLPKDAWAFADCSTVPFPGTPDPRKLCLRDGFSPDLLYEVVYDAKDPLVLGAGLAGMRDVASFFRYATTDSAGRSNPVAGAVKHTFIIGRSQSGNTLKTFLLQGFNEDEAHRIVFDGAIAHIAGRLTTINVRFGLPSGSGTLYEPGGEGVLWWTSYTDKVRGRPTASLLDRCTATKTCPKIFETFGAAEFNARLMTVALTGTDSKADLPLPDNVRRYYFPGNTHGGADQSEFAVAGKPAKGCVLAENPNFETEQMNALAVALIDWVTRGVNPPPSAYPMLAKGDLVANTQAAMGYPAIPGSPGPTGMAVGLMDYDFGPDLKYNDFAGVLSQQPPTIKTTAAPLMPRVNADGNEVAGVPSLLHSAPLGTYTGWNVTASGFFKGQPCGGGLTGGYIPFPLTKSDRERTGDPRLSIKERYGNQDGYMCVVKAAAANAVKDRFLLPADADILIGKASKAKIFPAEPSADANAVAAQVCRSVGAAPR